MLERPRINSGFMVKRRRLRRVTIKQSAKDLLRAIEDNYETVKGQTYIKQQYIADEMEELERLVK